MKRLAAILVIFVIMMTAAVTAAGEGISVRSEGGDKILIIEDGVISEPISGNAIIVLGDVTVRNRVDGHVITVFGDTLVDAEVSGQVVSIFGNTMLNDNARVMGDVIVIGSLSRSEGAIIGGQEVRILGESMNLDIGALSYLRLVVMMLYTLTVLIIGTLALIISRKNYNSIAKRLDRNFSRKLILGLLAFTGATALLLLLLVTLIAPLLYIILLLIASIPGFMFVGRAILKSFSPKNGVFAEFITGLVSVTLIKLIVILMIPQQSILIGVIIEGLICIFIYSLGLGILVEQHYLTKIITDKKAGNHVAASVQPGQASVGPEKSGNEDEKAEKGKPESNKPESSKPGDECRKPGDEKPDGEKP